LPKVAIFSTGNEIQDISTSSAMDPSVVWDANRPSIKAALKNVATILDYGIVKDK
jgi:molybdopterin biosynthesis enzyme